ncbi:hypothetical protein QUB08_30860 [Microcoleus sp. BR0-C5]|uniref:hypothetical protein n=1 Tax=Microcoleus sp. BR0-C5 TaxID=2818713 RepID=UPI002FD3F5D4
MNPFNFLLILTVSAAVLGLGKSGALAAVWNISETEPCLQIHSVRVAQRDDRNLSNSTGTLKEGSAISIDPDEVTGIPKAEARARFILNKIYRVQEGTTADDLFIFLRGFGEAIRPTPYLYPGRLWDTWTSPVKFTGFDVPKLNI